MPAPKLDYILTPAAQTELEKALDDYREKLIRNAGFTRGKSSFDKQDIQRSRNKITLPDNILKQEIEKDRREVSRISSLFFLLAGKLALLALIVYIAKTGLTSFLSLLTLTIINLGISVLLLFRLLRSRRVRKQKEKTAGMIVWQWSTIEALSSRFAPERENTARLISIFDYLNQEFRSRQDRKTLKDILRARNNIVHCQYIDLHQSKKLIPEADKFIRHLRNKANATST